MDCFFKTCAIIGFCLNLIVLIVLIVNKRRLKQYREEIDFLKSTLYQPNENKSQFGKIEIERVIEMYLKKESTIDTIMDSLRPLMEYDKDERRELVTSCPKEKGEESQSKTIYAASVNDNSIFQKVTEKIDSYSTTFKLYVNKNKATFDIEESVYATVLEDQAYLKNACDIEYLDHRSKVVIVAKGEAEKHSNGEWKVTKKAKVKFL